MKKLAITLIILISELTAAQNYIGSAPEIFFYRMASAKSEAMGKILTLNFDPYFVSQSNPANLATSKGAAAFYSYSSPLYTLDKASYNYLGASYNFPSIGAFALNVLWFNTGLTFNQTSEVGPEIIGTFEPTYQLYTLTYANELINWFDFGINANLFVNGLGPENYNSTFFELGLSRKFTPIQDAKVKDEILVATQLKNIFNQSIIINENIDEPFPSVFRIGISNLIEYSDKNVFEKSYLIGFTIGFEYQDLLNSKFRTAYKVGGELSIVDIIFLRGGYYNETERECDNCEGELNDFTYGFGLKLDFNRYLTKDFPLVLLFDFVSLEQPSYITDNSNWDNFTTFALIANYRIE